jgi:TonB family protein
MVLHRPVEPAPFIRLGLGRKFHVGLNEIGFWDIEGLPQLRRSGHRTHHSGTISVVAGGFMKAFLKSIALIFMMTFVVFASEQKAPDYPLRIQIMDVRASFSTTSSYGSSSFSRNSGTGHGGEAQTDAPGGMAGGQDKSTSVEAGQTTYPESPDGLKKVIEDSFGALKSGDTGKISAYTSSLKIPDHSEWFMKSFGAVEGPRLDSKYEELLRADNIRRRLEDALRGGWTNLSVTVLQKPVDPSQGIDSLFTGAMVEPIPLYVAVGSNPKEANNQIVVGDFVFAAGGFRYLDQALLRALSTAPPLRIKPGGILTAPALIHGVSPIYPTDAKKAHIQGTVVLHVIIGTDGTVKKIDPVGGDTALIKAAIEAVQQWRYKPTLVNGTPAEVDTTIYVPFRL